MKLEPIIQSEVSQKDKDHYRCIFLRKKLKINYDLISFLFGIWFCSTTFKIENLVSLMKFLNKIESLKIKLSPGLHEL